jgi:hypothetical protein
MDFATSALVGGINSSIHGNNHEEEIVSMNRGFTKHDHLSI